ncbi:retrovirus-related pol polyprotein from transposon TNT 1-94 [Tanacetum coccineum]
MLLSAKQSEKWYSITQQINLIGSEDTDEESMNKRTGSTITDSWKRYRKSYLHNQIQMLSHRNRGTKFLNKTLNAFFKEEGIEHQTSTPRTPEQNDVVERRNRTPVEAARTMFLAFKLPLDGENLDKMKEKGDPCILVGYSTQSKDIEFTTRELD